MNHQELFVIHNLFELQCMTEDSFELQKINEEEEFNFEEKK